MANRVYIAASLDGFIAEADGGLDWLNQLPNPTQSDFGFSHFIDSIDALVMGRNTFETVLGFGEWPYRKPVFVLSNRPLSIPQPLDGHVERVHGPVGAVVKHLNARGFTDLYIDGGRTIQAFLQADLIDEMIITWVSLLLGDGIPLFGRIGHMRRFRLIKSEMLNEHLAQHHYVRP
jgi:dihydrofolate reductase